MDIFLMFGGKKKSNLMYAVNQHFKGAIAFSVEADSSCGLMRK